MPKYTKEYLTNNKVAIATKTKEEWEKVLKKMLSLCDKLEQFSEWSFYDDFNHFYISGVS